MAELVNLKRSVAVIAKDLSNGAFAPPRSAHPFPACALTPRVLSSRARRRRPACHHGPQPDPVDQLADFAREPEGHT